MKWAALILAAILYGVWPYYTLLDLTQAVQTGNAKVINERVDWSSVRASVKSQTQAYLEARLDSPERRKLAKASPRAAGLDTAVAQSFANAMIDRVLTPEGIARFVGVSASRNVRARSRRASRLWRQVKFAFFVSPIHFRVDLGPRRSKRAALSVTLMFKGTGWQVTDVRLPKTDQFMALARPARTRRPQ